MRVCDRCNKPNPRYCMYIGGKNRDICDRCNKEYEELKDIFESIEKDFMRNKTHKHIDFHWE